MKVSTYTLRKYPVRMGFINILKEAQPCFPDTEDNVKVRVFLDDSSEEVSLTYQGKYKRLFGLTGWFREHQATPGDQVEIAPIAQDTYRLRFIKIKETAPRPKSPYADLPNLIVGTPINFRGIVYAPLNEAGVVLLFSKVMDDLGIVYEASPSRFPDAVVRRATSKGWELRFVEFEYKSSNFALHKHDATKCDIIVCWEHDWKGCPEHIEVIELRKVVQELGS